MTTLNPISEKQAKYILKHCAIPIEKREDMERPQKTHRRCILCDRYYRFPIYPCKPRDIICATCERNIIIHIAIHGKSPFRKRELPKQI